MSLSSRLSVLYEGASLSNCRQASSASCWSVPAGLARFGGGALVDEPARRRRVALGGYSATAVLSALIGLAAAVWQVAVLRVGAWVARGLRVPARNALLADVTTPEIYGRA